MRLYGKQVFNWKAISKIPMADRKAAIMGAFNHFLVDLGKSPVPSVSGQKFIGHDSNFEGEIPIRLIMPNFGQTPDRGYELLFDEVDMRESGNDSFEVMDVTNYITFYQLKPGEEAKLSRVPSAAKALVSMLRYIGGYAILDDWLRFNQYYKIDQLTEATVRKWYSTKAAIFYGLLTALTGIDQSFSIDDATTINLACANIITDLKAINWDVAENESFIITCHPLLRHRIMKALAAGFLNPNSNINQVVWNIKAVVTTTNVASTHYWVSLPGYKNQRGEWEDLNAREPQRNELVLGADHVWTGAFNGVIGEKKQHKKCALS